MSHPICTVADSGTLPYVRRLWGTLFAPRLDLGSKLERRFSEETDEFDLNTAFFSRVDPDADTQHFEVVHGPPEALSTGTTVPLSHTYCRRTVADPDGTMVVDDALTEGWAGDPAHERFGFGSYVGTTVTAEGKLYGTLCFANPEPREEPITDEEVRLVEMYGQWATFELNRWTGPPTRDPGAGDRLGGGGSLSPRIDAMMDALGKRSRRAVLLALEDDLAGDGADVVELAGDDETARLNLQHVHLPKLEAAGYVEWDRDANVVYRGPNFADVEPLLRLLRDYTAEFPG